MNVTINKTNSRQNSRINLKRSFNEKSMSILYTQHPAAELEMFFHKKGLANSPKSNIFSKLFNLKGFFSKSPV